LGWSDFLHRLDSQTLVGLLQTTSDCLLIASREGKLVWASRTAQELLGYSLEELLQLDIPDWVAPPYREWVAEQIRQNRTVQPGIGEVALVCRDGSWCYVDCSIQYLEIEGQMYAVAIAYDITETRLARTRYKTHSMDASEWFTSQNHTERVHLASKRLEAHSTDASEWFTSQNPTERVHLASKRLEAHSTDASEWFTSQNPTERVHLASKRLEALYQADEKLHASLELEEVLQALVDVCVDLLGADKSFILVWDRAQQHLLTRAHRGFTAQFVQRMDEYARVGLLAYAAQRGELVVVQDAHLDERVARRITDQEGIRAFMHIPIRQNGEVFGVFSIASLHPNTLGYEEQRVFTSLARRAAIAIRNARLYAQAQGRAALEERQRLARNLHDSVSQAIYGIVLGVRTAKTLLARNPEKAPAALDFVMNLAEGAMAEMRALIFELRPESLRQEGLVAALSKQIAAARVRHGLNLEAKLCSEPALSLEAKEALYRVAQEAIHNTARHARANRVHLHLHQEDDAVQLEIRDDGVGFDSQREYPGHLGLVSMRERIERLGGCFRLESSPGAGTTVNVVISTGPGR
jgi:PAS domain S-box-containing protein